MSESNVVLILESGEPRGDEGGRWVPTTNEATILATPVDRLVFLNHENKSDREIGNEDWVTRLREDMKQRYPTSHPDLRRVTFSQKYHYGGYGKEGRADNYHELLYFAATKKAEEMYISDDCDEVCQISKDLGGPVRIDNDTFMFQRNEFDDLTDELLELGCVASIIDEGEGCRYYVTYDPAAAQVKRLNRTKRKEKVKKTGRSVSFLTRGELEQGLKPLVNWLHSQGVIHAYDNWPFSLVYRGNNDRCQVIRGWIDTIEMINRVAGKNAHRSFPEFQKFLREVWKLHGEKTRSAFSCETKEQAENRESYSGATPEERLFTFFDQELKARKPRRTLNDVASEFGDRIDGLWYTEIQKKETAKRLAEDKAKEVVAKEKKKSG